MHVCYGGWFWFSGGVVWHHQDALGSLSESDSLFPPALCNVYEKGENKRGGGIEGRGGQGMIKDGEAR